MVVVVVVVVVVAVAVVVIVVVAVAVVVVVVVAVVVVVVVMVVVVVLFVHCSRSNWNLAVLIFAEGGKPENPEKNPRSEDENQQQTQPTYDAGCGNRTRATLVGGECSPHCAIPAPST